MAIIGFSIVVVLWAAFALALVFSQSFIHDTWRWFKARSLTLQVPVGILFLPWLLGMWIWEASWPAAVRTVAVAGVAWANVYVFLPWKLQ